MYAYFGGFSVFRPVLPVTGMLQLAVGISGEVYIINHIMSGDGIGGESSVQPHLISAGLLSTYMVLFVRELWLEKDGWKGKGKVREKGKKED
jgi:hypothetical protein